MRFIFTADWHIKTKFKDVPTIWIQDRWLEWLQWLEEQRKIHNLEILIIGGDIFDKLPTIYDLTMFVQLFHVCNFKKYIIFPGNHEMLKKDRSFYYYLHSILAQYKNVIFIYEQVYAIEDWLIVPYPLIKTIKEFNGYKKIISHVRCASDRGLYDAEIDFNIFKNLDMVLLGDIHHKVQFDNIYYPGSPYDISFSKLPLNDKYILIVDNGVEYITRSKFMRLVKLEISKDKYLSIKEKVKESKNFYDIEVQIDNIGEMDNIEGAKKKLVIGNNALTGIDEDELMYNYLVNSVKLDKNQATSILTDFKELI